MTTPAPPEDHELVPSCKATPHMLRAWGFPVKGSVVTHDEDMKGDDVWLARRKAVKVGFCSDEPLDETRPWVGQLKVTTEQRAEGMQLLAELWNAGQVRSSKDFQ